MNESETVFENLLNSLTLCGRKKKDQETFFETAMEKYPLKQFHQIIKFPPKTSRRSPDRIRVTDSLNYQPEIFTSTFIRAHVYDGYEEMMCKYVTRRSTLEMKIAS